jgi:hypothetical protein
VGRKSRGKSKGKPGPVTGITPDLAARLSRGLSPAELADPVLLRQITRGVSGLPSGSTLSFGEGSAPGAIPPEDLPEIGPDDADPDDREFPAEGGSLPLHSSQVIDIQAELQARLARRDPAWSDYLFAFIEDSLKRGVTDAADAYDKWGVMFQPARNGDEFCGLLSRQLAMARTYHVTGKMTNMVGAVYEKTASEVSSFATEDVPWPAGFAWLDKPVALKDKHGRVAMNRALSWNMERARYTGIRGTIPAVRITCWSGWGDQDEYWTPETGQLMRDMGGLSLAHCIIIPFGQEFRPLAERRADGSAPDDISRWLHALWLMLESEVVTLRRAGDVERHAAARAQRSLNHKDVTVVLLRRSTVCEAADGEPGRRWVDFTHRWPVQGFWRHHRKQGHHAVPDQSRESCLSCGGGISWVRPHLRGPADKPLQVKPQVYKLAR